MNKSGSVVWRCGCRSVNYLHWETCFNCGALQPAPPDPKKPETLGSIEKHVNKS